MEDFATYEIAVKLKEKGFTEPCRFYYSGSLVFPNQRFQLLSRNTTEDNSLDAPTISQVLKWLREEKNISIQPLSERGNIWESQITFTDENDRKLVEKFLDRSLWAGYGSKTYEDAALLGIEYVLNNLI